MSTFISNIVSDLEQTNISEYNCIFFKILRQQLYYDDDSNLAHMLGWKIKVRDLRLECKNETNLDRKKILMNQMRDYFL